MDLAQLSLVPAFDDRCAHSQGVDADMQLSFEPSNSAAAQRTDAECAKPAPIRDDTDHFSRFKDHASFSVAQRTPARSV